MPGRTPIEKLSDHLLLLVLIREVNARGYIGGVVKLQKLTFLSEWVMIDKSMKGFDYNFIKLSYGPYSQELDKDIDVLVSEKLLTGRSRIAISDHAADVLQKIVSLFEANQSFVEVIEYIAESLSQDSGEAIRDAIYKLDHPYLTPTRKIRDLKVKTPIIYRMKEAQIRFEIPEVWLPTLETYLSFGGSKALEEAVASAKQEHSLSFEDVFR